MCCFHCHISPKKHESLQKLAQRSQLLNNVQKSMILSRMQHEGSSNVLCILALSMRSRCQPKGRAVAILTLKILPSAHQPTLSSKVQDTEYALLLNPRRRSNSPFPIKPQEPLRYKRSLNFAQKTKQQSTRTKKTTTNAPLHCNPSHA